jgi:hypothetical protein
MTKGTIATAQLADLIMNEISNYPECAHVTSVAFTRPPRAAPHHANWEPAFSCQGPKIAPAVAWEIARKFQNQYDLV